VQTHTTNTHKVQSHTHTHTWILSHEQMHREKQIDKVARFKGFRSVPAKDEKAMMEAVATHGPVAISYDADDVGMK